VKSVKLLLDMCHEKCGSDAEVARRVGVPRSHVAMWRSGARPMSAETAAMLADILELPGEEAREWMAIAVIENPKNASRVEVLKRALFACWALGVVSLCMPSTDALGMATNVAGRTTTRATNALDGYVSVTDARMIVAHALRRLARWLHRLTAGLDEYALMARGTLRGMGKTCARDYHPTPTAIAAAG
jgi:transcriptional regulator with XRE-family HTH domain